MKIQTPFEVIDKTTKTGTSDRGDWSITEYVLHVVEKRDDGSELETDIVAQASDKVGELSVGAKYDGTLFITSRKYNDRIFNGFRITFAKKTADAPAQAEQVETVVTDDVVDDSIPF